MKFLSIDHLYVVCITLFFLALNWGEATILNGIAIYGAMLAVQRNKLFDRTIEKLERQVQELQKDKP
jgi:hypothetical protein